MQSNHFGLQKRECCQQRVITDFLESEISTFHWLSCSLCLAGTHLQPSLTALCLSFTSHSHPCQGDLGGKLWKAGKCQPVTVVQENPGRVLQTSSPLCASIPKASRLQHKGTTPLRRVLRSGDVLILLRETTDHKANHPHPNAGAFRAGSQLKDLRLHLQMGWTTPVFLLSKGSGTFPFIRLPLTTDPLPFSRRPACLYLPGEQ